MTATLLLIKNQLQESKTQSTRCIISITKGTKHWFFHHVINKYFVQMFGPRVKVLGCGILHGAARPSTKPRRSFSGWPGHWGLPDRENSFVLAGGKRAVMSTSKKIPFAAAAAAALHHECWLHVWEQTEGTLPGHAGCAPSMPAACLPQDILGVMFQPAALAKRTVLPDKGRCKT